MSQTNIEKRFTSLKKKLESLNFCHPFSYDSIDLVSNLLTELVKTSEGYHKLKMGIGDWGLGIGDWAQSPIPNPQSP